MDRLFELVVILLLRHMLSSRNESPGMMAGLADPRLARPLNLMHEGAGQGLERGRTVGGGTRPGPVLPSTSSEWSGRPRWIIWSAGASAWRRKSA